MEDAPTAAHTATCNHDRAALDGVDPHRIFSRLCGGHCKLTVIAEERRTLQLRVPQVKLRRLDGHRAIEIDLPVGEAEVVVMLGEQVEKVLRTPDGERRNQDIASSVRPAPEYTAQLIERGVERPVIAIAVRALHDH